MFRTVSMGQIHRISRLLSDSLSSIQLLFRDLMAQIWPTGGPRPLNRVTLINGVLQPITAHRDTEGSVGGGEETCPVLRPVFPPKQM